MGQARDWWDDQKLIKEAVAEAARDAERSHAELVRWAPDDATKMQTEFGKFQNLKSHAIDGNTSEGFCYQWQNKAGGREGV